MSLSNLKIIFILKQLCFDKRHFESRKRFFFIKHINPGLLSCITDFIHKIISGICSASSQDSTISISIEILDILVSLEDGFDLEIYKRGFLESEQLVSLLPLYNLSTKTVTVNKFPYKWCFFFSWWGCGQ